MNCLAKLAATVGLALLLGACGRRAVHIPKGALDGTWQHSASTQLTLHLNPDGTFQSSLSSGEVTGMNTIFSAVTAGLVPTGGTWTATGETLVLRGPEAGVQFRVRELATDRFVCTLGEKKNSLVFVRKDR